MSLKNIALRARINDELKREVETPNKLTQKILADSVEGKNIKKFNSVDELFNDLDN